MPKTGKTGGLLECDYQLLLKVLWQFFECFHVGSGHLFISEAPVLSVRFSLDSSETKTKEFPYSGAPPVVNFPFQANSVCGTKQHDMFSELGFEVAESTSVAHAHKSSFDVSEVGCGVEGNHNIAVGRYATSTGQFQRKDFVSYPQRMV